MNVSWIARRWFVRPLPASSRTQRARASRRSALRLESLEDRALFAVDSLCPTMQETSAVSSALAAAAGRNVNEVHPVFAPGTADEIIRSYDDLPNQAGFDNFEFVDSDRWTRTSAGTPTLGQGDATVIRWSIVPDGTAIAGSNGEPAAPSNLRAFLNSIYGANSASSLAQNQPWFSVIQSTFDRWSAVSGVTYVYEPADDGAALGASSNGVVNVRGDVRISGHTIDGPSNILAYNFYPTVGDMVLDTGDTFFTNTAGNSLRLRNTMAHELGHGLGLGHVTPTNGTKLMEPSISLTFDGPQPDDILAVNRGYGDRLEKNGGNNTFATATALTSGTFTVDTISIDDDSDLDWFKVTVGAGASLNVTATPTGSTYTSNGVTFNSLAQSNLALSVYASNGTTVLASANVNGAGVGETLANVALPGAGTYYVRVSGSANAAQMYRLTGTVSNVTAVGPEIAVTESAADIADNTSSVNYGTVNVGAVATKTFTVTNVGSANLTLGPTIGLTGAFTLVQGLGATTLTPGASTTFVVNMNTTAVSTPNGVVTLTTNDVDENPFNFALAGTVVSPNTPPPPTAAFSDAFNRANSTLLGSSWSEVAGNISISNNGIVNSTSGTSVAVVNNIALADVVLTADVNLGTGTSSRDMGVSARYSGTGAGNQYWGGLAYNSGRFYARIWEATNGNWTLLSSTAVSSGSGAIRFEVVGASLKLYVNGALTNSVTDASLTSGRVGVSASATGARLDNFSAAAAAAFTVPAVQAGGGGGARSTTNTVNSAAAALASARAAQTAAWTAAIDHWMAFWEHEA